MATLLNLISRLEGAILWWDCLWGIWRLKERESLEMGMMMISTWQWRLHKMWPNSKNINKSWFLTSMHIIMFPKTFIKSISFILNRFLYNISYCAVRNGDPPFISSYLWLSGSTHCERTLSLVTQDYNLKWNFLSSQWKSLLFLRIFPQQFKLVLGFWEI